MSARLISTIVQLEQTRPYPNDEAIRKILAPFLADACASGEIDIAPSEIGKLDSEMVEAGYDLFAINYHFRFHSTATMFLLAAFLGEYVIRHDFPMERLPFTYPPGYEGIDDQLANVFAGNAMDISEISEEAARTLASNPACLKHISTIIGMLEIWNIWCWQQNKYPPWMVPALYEISKSHPITVRQFDEIKFRRGMKRQFNYLSHIELDPDLWFVKDR